MKFESVTVVGESTAKDVPRVILARDRWNDFFRFETQFRAVLVISSQEYVSLGTVKIMRRDTDCTELQRRFEGLDEFHCSLGQTSRYYETLRGLGAVGMQVLIGLRDAAVFPEIHDAFHRTECFQRSLLRSSEAQRALEAVRADPFDNQGTPRNANLEAESVLNVSYSFDVAGFQAKHKLNLVLDGRHPWGRIGVLIGKNGSGKTQLLAHLAGLFSGLYDAGKEVDRPTNVIAVSYSAFDTFTRPKGRDTPSYVYCGLRDADGRVSLDHALQQTNTALVRVFEDEGLTRLWRNAASDTALFGPDAERLGRKRTANQVVEVLERFSSGQKALALVVANILPVLKSRSLVLFDEPETHLHPNALSALLRWLQETLRTADAFCVISTHSPLVIQETPAKFVRIVDVDGRTPIIRNYEGECFGEGLSELTERAFRVSVDNQNYLRRLESLSSDTDARSLLGRPLSLGLRVAMTTLGQKP